MASTLYINGTVVQPAWLNDVDIATYDTLSAVAGTNTVTATGPVTMLAYSNALSFFFVPAVTNTGAVTININGLGAKSITKQGATALIAGDLVAGTVALVKYDGTQFQLLNPSTFNLSQIIAIANGGTGITSIIPVGQCRLTKSGANILLSPYQGNKLAFPTVFATVPAAGVTLAPTALTPLTLYYVYAVQTAGVVTSLEASTTGHSTDTTTGIEYKTGDTTRVLVGMVRPIAGPVFQDTANQRFVISWFNQRDITTSAAFTATRITLSTVYAEVNAEIRNEFLCWASTGLQFSVQGGVFNNTNAAQTNTAIGLDGTTAIDGYSVAGNQAATSNIVCSLGLTATTTPSEGYHFVTLLGSLTAGTASWTGGATVGNRTSLQGRIQG